MAIIIHELEHRYEDGSAGEKVALHDVNIKIEQGEMIGLIGHTGSGKSTLIQHLNGLLKPTSGAVFYDGKDINDSDFSKKKLRSKVGLVFQYPEYQLFESTVIDDVKFGPKNIGMDSLKIDMNSFQALKQVGIGEDLLDVSPLELSGGQKRRVAIAGVLAMEPEVLILDEPTAGLDVEARNEILDLLREYIAQDEKRTILITSHISTDLESLCDDIYLIHDGKIILHEDTDVILEQYGILKVNEEQYRTLDKTAVIKVQKETYGYACFTNDRRFYQENYPQIAVEQGGIDELILMMTGGYR